MKIDWAKDWQGFELSITTYCQANCPLCVRTDRQTGKLKSYVRLEHSNIDTIIKTINDVAKYTSCEKIQLCGDYGDPLMHPHIEDIIYEVEKVGLWTSIHTNGGLRNPGFYKKIAMTTETVFVFGIDGIDEKTNSKYRIGVNFDKAMENMKTFGAYAKKYYSEWDFLIFDYNYEQLDEAIEIAESNNIKLNFRINTRDWKYKITDKKLIEHIRSKYKERLL
jgi:MoaA/NifB/PqqE/SkfB family radical SAM enzyme